jgi:putative ABC transport system ATP-binding protein
VFQRLNDEGLTIAMVTHEPDMARFASRIVVLRDGRVRADRPAARQSAAAVRAAGPQEDDLLDLEEAFA